MRNVGQKVKVATKQTAQQAAQMAADAARRESFETIKTGQSQVLGREKIVDRTSDPGIVGYIKEQTAQNADAHDMREEIERRRQQDLRMWQNKLEQIKYDMETKGQQQIKQEYEHVEQVQQDRMAELTPKESVAPVLMSQSKPNKGKGLMGKVKKAVTGVKNAVEQKMRKRETERGAKG